MSKPRCHGLVAAHGQAAFEEGGAFIAQRMPAWVDQRHKRKRCALPFAGLVFGQSHPVFYDSDAHADAYLRGGKPDTRGRVHGCPHDFEQTEKLFV